MWFLGKDGQNSYRVFFFFFFYLLCLHVLTYLNNREQKKINKLRRARCILNDLRVSVYISSLIGTIIYTKPIDVLKVCYFGFFKTNAKYVVVFKKHAAKYYNNRRATLKELGKKTSAGLRDINDT